MSVSSVNSNFSTTSLSSTSRRVKSSSEYRALRQQFFQLQSSHNSLKLVHEREMILAAGQRAQLQEQVKKLQNELDEIKKDQVFLLNSEKEALKELESVKQEKSKNEQKLFSKIQNLERELQQEQEAHHLTKSELIKLKLKDMENTNTVGYDEEFVTNLLNEWKDRVITLTNQNNSLQEQLETLNLMKSNKSNTQSDNSEELRQKILSTYVSLESAQHTLSQKRSEIERLTTRIGNIKVLEENYRDAQIKIKRLENTKSSGRESPAPDTNNQQQNSPVLSNSASDLKLIQLTQEIGALKESLALSNLNFSSLQSELAASKTSQETLQAQLDESTRSIGKLTNSLKVKDATIASLKEQLDSTVNLLTETLKKKNKQ